jgi:hypothetical protein
MSAELQLDVFDFDSTIFNLPGFMRALPLAAQAEFGISAEAFATEIPSFYVGKIGYDVYAHLAHHKRNLKDRTVFDQIKKRTLAVHKHLTGENDLLFPDARVALQQLKTKPNRVIAIMSVNLESGFLFKRSLCGTTLDDIPYRIVETNKGTILAHDWAGVAIVYDGVTYTAARFVDDGDAQVEQAPKRPDVKRIQIVRNGQRYPQTDDPDIRVIKLLTELI